MFIFNARQWSDFHKEHKNDPSKKKSSKIGYKWKNRQIMGIDQLFYFFTFVMTSRQQFSRYQFEIVCAYIHLQGFFIRSVFCLDIYGFLF